MIGAFSDIGKIRQLHIDLIKTKHNSNKKTQQTTLEGEIIQEYTYYLLGFVPADVVRLKKGVRFCELEPHQISMVEDHLSHKWNISQLVSNFINFFTIKG